MIFRFSAANVESAVSEKKELFENRFFIFAPSCDNY